MHNLCIVYAYMIYNDADDDTICIHETFMYTRILWAVERGRKADRESDTQ